MSSFSKNCENGIAMPCPRPAPHDLGYLFEPLDLPKRLEPMPRECLAQFWVGARLREQPKRFRQLLLGEIDLLKEAWNRSSIDFSMSASGAHLRTKTGQSRLIPGGALVADGAFDAIGWPRRLAAGVVARATLGRLFVRLKRHFALLRRARDRTMTGRAAACRSCILQHGVFFRILAFAVHESQRLTGTHVPA